MLILISIFSKIFKLNISKFFPFMTFLTQINLIKNVVPKYDVYPFTLFPIYVSHIFTCNLFYYLKIINIY